MQSPIQRLGAVVSALPEYVREAIVWNGCLALGRGPARNDKPFDEDVPMGELYDPLTVEDLCDEMQTLVDERGMMEEFVIDGLFQFVISWHERMADADISGRILDRSLSMLQRLESELRKPLDQRDILTSDDVLKKMIQQLKDGMTRRPKFKEECLDLAFAVRSAWETSFPSKYWDDWDGYASRQRKN